MVPLIRQKSRIIKDLMGNELRVLEEERAAEIAVRFACSVRAVHESALDSKIYPSRYIRNRSIISRREQLALCRSCVVVIGAGGLGGQVILLLARIGVGRLVVVDHDCFDETNLNRQALSGMDVLGQPKCQVAALRVRNVNPGIQVMAFQKRLNSDNAAELIGKARVAVDALDNVEDRFVLQDAVRHMGIPLVHGALAGFEGQLMTIFPDDNGLEMLYGNGGNIVRKESPEALLGVPALTPSLIGTLQAMEVVKILLGRGRPFRNEMVYGDLETGELNHFAFKEK